MMILHLRFLGFGNSRPAGSLKHVPPSSRLHLSPSLCLSSSLAEQFLSYYISLVSMRIKGKSEPLLPLSCLSLSSQSPPTPSPQSSSKPPSLTDGKNFNDSSEDSSDLIGNCGCHSKDLGLFGGIKRGRKRSGDEGREEKERKNGNPGFVLTKETSWILYLLAVQADFQQNTLFSASAARSGRVPPLFSMR